MIDPKQIPEEVVRAVDRALAELLTDEVIRKAWAAGINAWPDAGMRTIMDADGSYPTVFLPLPAPEEKP
jgi:hypothetical protein